MIRSGSATVPEAWTLLNHDNHTFAATVRDDDQSTEALFQHLDATGEWHKQGRVAILAESGPRFKARTRPVRNKAPTASTWSFLVASRGCATLTRTCRLPRRPSW